LNATHQLQAYAYDINTTKEM